MSSALYNYILGQWKMEKVTAEWVQARVPKFIIQEECDTILATPQGVLTESFVSEVVSS